MTLYVCAYTNIYVFYNIKHSHAYHIRCDEYG